MARKKQEKPQRDAKTVPQKIARKQLIAKPFPELQAKSQARREGRKQLIAGTKTDEDSSARKEKGTAPLKEAEQLSKELTREQYAVLLRDIDKEKRKLALFIKDAIKDPKLKEESFGTARSGTASGKQRTDRLNASAIPKLRGVVPQPLLDMYRDMETRQSRMNKQFKSADKQSKSAGASQVDRFNIGDNVELSWYGKKRQGEVVDANVSGGKVKIKIEGLGDRMLPADRLKINKKFFQKK